VVQGLTLPYIIRRSRVFDLILREETPELTRVKIRDDLKAHVQQYLVGRNGVHSKVPGLERFLKLWEEKAQASNEMMSDEVRSVYFELLETQRDFLNKLNKDPMIDEEIIRAQLYQIDLEEERLKLS
jgi:CPA1 family monovalent cation:H+ antiporter